MDNGVAIVLQRIALGIAGQGQKGINNGNKKLV
jgi:hypothetical protein